MQTEPPENLTDSPQQATHQFLSFQVPPDIHAMVSAQELTEIVSLSPNQIVPIPDVPPQVMGVCSWRGEVLWLVDLGYLLGQDSLFQQGYRHANYSLIVVRHQRNTLGLVVNQIGTMIWHNASEIYPITPPPSATKLAPCFQGCWLTPQGKTLWFLDCQALINFFQNDSG
jgi:positive phototaxis protein PixI